MKDKVYISFYNKPIKHDKFYKRFKSGITLTTICEIVKYLDEIEDKQWALADIEDRPLFKNEIPLGVYLNNEDAILFKLKFGIGL